MNKKDYVIALVKGKRSDDTDFWAYVAIHPSQYAEFKIAESEGNYSLTDYGKIIKHGSGTEPPDEARQYMEEHYDFGATLEQSLAEHLSKT